MRDANPKDVAVIGAGFPGLCAARDLAEGGAEVVVLEARDRVAIAAIAHHGGLPSALLTALRFSPREGWTSLAEAMASGLPIRLATTVTRVAESSDHVDVFDEQGLVASARWAILAVPINVLAASRWSRSSQSHCTRCWAATAVAPIKVWMRARGLPAGSLAAGRGHGIHWLYADRELAGGEVLALGFGYQDRRVDPASSTAVSEALASVWPDAQLTGRRLVLAGSDVSRREAGWIEGALLSGADAASWVLERLDSAGAGVRFH